MGKEVSTAIEKLFEEKEFASASILDATASIAADRASEVMEELYMEDLSSRELVTGDHFVFGYSPGYCGWHITAQRKLFQFLDPGRIGIELNDSCLMTPLKSITGLLVSGVGDIHLFEPKFGYCRSCMHRSCLERLDRISSNKPSTA
jgi:cobalamin-dependent methionine synthase I